MFRAAGNELNVSWRNPGSCPNECWVDWKSGMLTSAESIPASGLHSFYGSSNLAEINSSKLFRTLNLRWVSFFKCLPPSLILSAMTFLHTCGIFFLSVFFFPQENYIIYSAISRKHCGWKANGEADGGTQLANLTVSRKWCMSTRTNVGVQW